MDTSMPGPAGALMAAEIAEQPTVLRRLLAGAGAIDEVGAQVRRRRPRFMLLAARGTSDHAALYAKYLAEIRLGWPVGLASPSALTVYGARPDLTDVLFVAVSQSGGSSDLVDSTLVANDCGALTVAVTNNPSSDLAQAAQLHVDVRAGVEHAVAATKTYTAELFALYLLLGGTSATETAARLPDAAETTIDAGHAAVPGAAGRYRFAEKLVTTARGYSYATAREAALKLMETSYVAAQAFSGADLLHGPLAMIDSGVPVIAVATPGRGGDAIGPVIERLREAGADVLRVGPHTGQDLPVHTDGIAEELLPILEIIPLQQLALRLALDRGGDPDAPRGLSKVTSTW